MTRARFVVRGVVQGVNFRAAAAREATARGLAGRVWNRADGAVELVAEGDAPSLDALQAWLSRGPRFARVEGVDRSPAGGEPRYRDFAIADGAPE
ncbi:MAG: acylphosphatase [Chloroflexota bacterium]|nr:acylphosphatase [Candidatus Limnocylindria bacterium]